MARVPQPSDLVALIRRLEQRVRRLELRSGAHMETKTFLVGGDVETGLFIPWVALAVNLDDRSPEWKELISFGGQTRVGSITVSWELDDSVIYEDHVISTTFSSVDLRAELPADVLLLTPGWHRLRPVVTDGTATDISLAYATATGRR